MKIRFINAVCILALILASASKSANASQLKDKEMMITEKKNIGSKLALYPMPVTVVGAEVNGKVNWLLVAHVRQAVQTSVTKRDAGARHHVDS